MTRTVGIAISKCRFTGSFLFGSDQRRQVYYYSYYYYSVLGMDMGIRRRAGQGRDEKCRGVGMMDKKTERKGDTDRQRNIVIDDGDAITIS